MLGVQNLPTISKELFFNLATFYRAHLSLIVLKVGYSRCTINKTLFFLANNKKSRKSKA